MARNRRYAEEVMERGDPMPGFDDDDPFTSHEWIASDEMDAARNMDQGLPELVRRNWRMIRTFHRRLTPKFSQHNLRYVPPMHEAIRRFLRSIMQQFTHAISVTTMVGVYLRNRSGALYYFYAEENTEVFASERVLASVADVDEFVNDFPLETSIIEDFVYYTETVSEVLGIANILFNVYELPYAKRVD